MPWEVSRMIGHRGSGKDFTDYSKRRMVELRRNTWVGNRSPSSATSISLI